MPKKITRRYSRIGPHTSSGTRSRVRIGSRQTKARPVSSNVAPAMSTNEARTLSCKPASSRCPKRMENKAPLPMHSPSKMEVRKVIRVKEEPTAAKAFFPRHCPTIKVSAIL